MKANDDPPRWTIGELAERVGAATHVLRHWEDEGLVVPERDSAGYRRYGRAELVRVLAIQRNKIAGMSLPQIRALLDGAVIDRADVLQEHLRDLDERERELRRSRAMTEHALRCRAHDIAQCPRFASYVVDLVEGRQTGPIREGELTD